VKLSVARFSHLSEPTSLGPLKEVLQLVPAHLLLRQFMVDVGCVVNFPPFTYARCWLGTKTCVE